MVWGLGAQKKNGLDVVRFVLFVVVFGLEQATELMKIFLPARPPFGLQSALFWWTLGLRCLQEGEAVWGRVCVLLLIWIGLAIAKRTEMFGSKRSRRQG